MKKLNISVKDRKNHIVTVYLDNKELGIIDNDMEVELTKVSHSIYIKYGKKTSNTIVLKNTDSKDSKIEIDKAISVERLFIMLIPLFLALFSFYKTLGVVSYFFRIALFLVAVLTFLNWNRLILKKVK